MRLAPGAALDIALAFAPDAHVPVGRLAWADQTAQLEWSREIIQRQLPVEGDIRYKQEAGLLPARSRALEGLHGFLNDSLPEEWGYLVMRKRLAQLQLDIASLTPVERLALVGESGRGALIYDPATTPDADQSTGIDLDALANEAAQMLSGEVGNLADLLCSRSQALLNRRSQRPQAMISFFALPSTSRAMRRM